MGEIAEDPHDKDDSSHVSTSANYKVPEETSQDTTRVEDTATEQPDSQRDDDDNEGDQEVQMQEQKVEVEEEDGQERTTEEGDADDEERAAIIRRNILRLKQLGLYSELIEDNYSASKRPRKSKKRSAVSPTPGEPSAPRTSSRWTASKKAKFDASQPSPQGPPPPVRYSLRSRGQPTPVDSSLADLTTSASIDRGRYTFEDRKRGELAFGDVGVAGSGSSFLNRISQANSDALKRGEYQRNEQEEEEEDWSVNKYSSVYHGLTIPFEAGTIEVAKAMVYSACFHPSTTQLLAAVGDASGSLYFWDVQAALDAPDVAHEQPVVYSFRPHTLPISRLLYHPQDVTKLFTCSFDASVRCMDIQAEKFAEVLTLPDDLEDARVTYADLDSSGNICWFTSDEGHVGHLDRRVGHVPTSDAIYPISFDKVNTVHLSPTQQHLIATAGLDRTVKIFDTRHMKQVQEGGTDKGDDLYAPIAVLQHRGSVNCAFWDWQTGRDLVSTSFDATLGLWKDPLSLLVKEDNGRRSSQDPDMDKCLKSIPHWNQTGKFVQKLKATWNHGPTIGGTIASTSSAPTTSASASAECVFAIADKEHTVSIFSGSTGQRVAKLWDGGDGKLTAIPAVTVFHPSLPMLVSGNARGRMTIWK